MANPYTERLQSLNSKRVDSNVRQIKEMIGLPLVDPRNKESLISPSGVPTGLSPKPIEPGEDESYKSSAFYHNFDTHRQGDPHFDSMTNEMTKLATGLRKQVEAGYMPPQIAQDRLQQFVVDSFHARKMAQPHIQRQKEQEAKKVDQDYRAESMLNLIAQNAVNNPAKGSEYAQPDPTPAIQNLSAQQGDQSQQQPPQGDQPQGAMMAQQSPQQPPTSSPVASGMVPQQGGQ